MTEDTPPPLSENPLTVVTQALIDAVERWADARTGGSKRRHDLLRDKFNALLSTGQGGTAAGFFRFCNKPIEAITPDDVSAWQTYLEEMKLSQSSIYARVSRVSSFYDWLMEQPTYQERITDNPAKHARPKAPKAYGSEKAKGLTDDDVERLLQYVAVQATDKDNISAKRDYALLRFYFATGKRRSEIINLRWSDLTFDGDKLIIHTIEQGGLHRSSEIRDPGVQTALVAYLKASNRWDYERGIPSLDGSAPLWLRHDRAAKGKQPVTSHGFVYMLKKYAKAAGLGSIHLNQTRHTVARMVVEKADDLSEVQTLLGHQNPATTRIYLERVAAEHGTSPPADDDAAEQSELESDGDDTPQPSPKSGS